MANGIRNNDTTKNAVRCHKLSERKAPPVRAGLTHGGGALFMSHRPHRPHA